MTLARKTVLSTPWFDVVARDVPGDDRPYYSLTLADYVTVIATTPGERLVLVRQFRPAVETHTLELPSGHVDPGESPDLAARRELLEETGYEAESWEALSPPLLPDTGRLSNRMWCYRARNARRTYEPHAPEAGIETVLLTPRDLAAAVGRGELVHALHLAVLFLADFRRSEAG